MQAMSRRYAFKTLLAGAALGLGAAPVFAKSAMPNMAKPASGPVKPDITFHGQGFEPMMSHIVAGGGVEIRCAAGNALQLTSAPGAPEKIHHTVGPTAQASLRFAKPGLYLLYDSTTTRFDEKVGQVVARRKAKSFPLPAYMVILVTTANGRGIANTKPQIAIPDSFMTFEPWAIVVNAGQPITFTNHDNDLHIAMPSPEPMLMPNPNGGGGQLGTAMWLEHMQSFAPITLPGHGGKGVLTLGQPGLHHYYCPVHAAYDATAYTFAPLKSFGGYPFIMDGVIVVLPT